MGINHVNRYSSPIQYLVTSANTPPTHRLRNLAFTPRKKLNADYHPLSPSESL